MNRRVAALACAGLLSLAAQADDGAVAWLSRSGTALSTTNYIGEILRETNARTERVRIVHRYRDGRVSERLVSLAPNGRELVRDGEEVTIFLPAQRTAIIERRPPAGPAFGALPRFDADVARWYRIEQQGRETGIAGRPVVVIAVTPRDGYRFGYRLWIDEASAIPLRSELRDASGTVLERVEFTSIDLPREIADSEFEPSIDAASFRWVKQAPEPAPPTPAWRVAQVPPGFRLSATAVQAMPGAPAPVTHLVYTDGLASVSVFIQSPSPGRPTPQGQGRLGPASAISTLVKGKQVTAVGEVPLQTVQFIAAGVEPVTPDARR